MEDVVLFYSQELDDIALTCAPYEGCIHPPIEAGRAVQVLTKSRSDDVLALLVQITEDRLCIKARDGLPFNAIYYEGDNYNLIRRRIFEPDIGSLVMRRLASSEWRWQPQSVPPPDLLSPGALIELLQAIILRLPR